MFILDSSVIASQGHVAVRATVGHHLHGLDEERDGGKAAGYRTADDADGTSKEPLQDTLPSFDP